MSAATNRAAGRRYLAAVTAANARLRMPRAGRHVYVPELLAEADQHPADAEARADALVDELVCAGAAR